MKTINNFIHEAVYAELTEQERLELAANIMSTYALDHDHKQADNMQEKIREIIELEVVYKKTNKG